MADTDDRNTDLGKYLVDLLANHGPYRRRWEREVATRSGSEINQAAVARVLASYLVDSGERSAYEEGLDRQLKDRVARAVTGRSGAETLRWVVAAFEMTGEHAAGLWDRFASNGPLGGQVCRSVAVHEIHQLGPDGLPLLHRTIQVLRAEAPRATGYIHRFDANVASVEVLRGGVAGPVTEDEPGLWSVEIAFDRPILQGETVSLEYLTRFDWREPPAPRLRRACLRRVGCVEMRVQWDPGRLPASVVWADWDGIDGPIRQAEEVALSPDHSVHRFLERVERRVVGFAWTWA